MSASRSKHTSSHAKRTSSGRAKNVVAALACVAVVCASFVGAYLFASNTKDQAAQAPSSQSSAPDASGTSTESAQGPNDDPSDAAGGAGSNADGQDASSSEPEEQPVNKTGIDVSETQGAIDWNAVAASDVKFAFIRLGYRGSSEGKIYADETYKDNLTGAKAAGIERGAYFYSQAITPEEAVEEARYVIDALAGEELDYPVAFDYEIVNPFGFSRISAVTPDMATRIARAFCTEIERAGFDAIIYGNGYDLEHLGVDVLKTWPIWYAEYSEDPSYQGEFAIWQYSCTGRVDGINMDVDMNLDMRTVPGALAASDEEDAQTESDEAAAHAEAEAEAQAQAAADAQAQTAAQAKAEAQAQAAA